MEGNCKLCMYLALTLDMSGVLQLTPGLVMTGWVVVSRLPELVLILSLGRDKLPRLLFLPGVGGPGLVYPVSPRSLLEDRTLDREKVEMLESWRNRG